MTKVLNNVDDIITIITTAKINDFCTKARFIQRKARRSRNQGDFN